MNPNYSGKSSPASVVQFSETDGAETPKDNPPLAPTPAGNSLDDKYLKGIQGNILKSHGRPFTRLVLFRFDDSDPDAGLRQIFRDALEATDAVGTRWGITTAYEQWQDAQSGDRNRPFYGLGISLSGLHRCDCAEPSLPLFDLADPSIGFGASMNQSFQGLGDVGTIADPAVPDWETVYRDGVDGVWLLAHAEPGQLNAMELRITDFLTTHRASKVAVERGQAWRDKDCKPREPFGFRDGISDPVFFADDCYIDGAGAAWVPKWTNIPRRQVVIDRLSQTGVASLHDGGSFLVLRKLEQNVAAFRKLEKDIKDAFTQANPPVPIVTTDTGALLIGRERDGRPLAALTGLPDANGDENKFDFNSEVSRCPFHAHIRKTAPRANPIAPLDGLPPLPDGHRDLPTARDALFVRRSAVYDDYGQLPPSGKIDDTNAANYLNRNGAEIERGVGLLFMGYMSSIPEQFVRMQRNWFGNLHFPFGKTHLPDPLIRPLARLGGANPEPWTWSSARNVSVPLTQTVKPRGGAYFYVPSIAWLQAQAPAREEQGLLRWVQTLFRRFWPR